MTNSYKVRIKGPDGEVAFEASSPVSESRTANYEGYNIVHMPVDLLAYRSTSSRRFSIVGKLVSRTAAEANANGEYLNMIRSWLLPDFGRTGATPPTVRLFAYGNKNINGVKCVIRSYGFTFPDDVDYIYKDTSHTTGGVVSSPMPVIGILQIDLDEIYSAEEISGSGKTDFWTGETDLTRVWHILRVKDGIQTDNNGVFVNKERFAFTPGTTGEPGSTSQTLSFASKGFTGLASRGGLQGIVSGISKQFGSAGALLTKGIGSSISGITGGLGFGKSVGGFLGKSAGSINNSSADIQLVDSALLPTPASLGNVGGIISSKLTGIIDSINPSKLLEGAPGMGAFKDQMNALQKIAVPELSNLAPKLDTGFAGINSAAVKTFGDVEGSFKRKGDSLPPPTFSEAQV